MKKTIPLLAILGGAAAFVAYKIKQDEQKKIIDLDEGMLHDEMLDEEDAVDEVANSDSATYGEDAKEAVKDIIDGADKFIKKTTDKVEDIAKDTKKEIKKAAKNIKEVFPNLVEEEIQELKDKTKELMDKMKKEGDVHEHERPVQHTVRFETIEDVESFKDALIKKGYVISNGDSDKELIVLHITPLDEVKLIANILYIANEARKCQGRYEGWSSKVSN